MCGISRITRSGRLVVWKSMDAISQGKIVVLQPLEDCKQATRLLHCRNLGMAPYGLGSKSNGYKN